MKTIFLSLGLLMIFVGGCTREKDATPKNLIMVPKPAAPKSPPASGGATPETIPQTAPTTQPAPDMTRAKSAPEAKVFFVELKADQKVTSPR